MHEIYALIDPRTGEPRYIGKANNSAARFKRHMHDRHRRDYPVYRWINKLSEMGLRPSVKVLEVAQDWREAERRLIALSRAQGLRLLNVADGGDQPHCSPDQRKEGGRRLAEYYRDKPRLLLLREYKRRLAVAIRDGYASNKTRAKLRLLAAKQPRLFGEWATLQDRVE